MTDLNSPLPAADSASPGGMASSTIPDTPSSGGSGTAVAGPASEITLANPPSQGDFSGRGI